MSAWPHSHPRPRRLALRVTSPVPSTTSYGAVVADRQRPPEGVGDGGDGGVVGAHGAVELGAAGQGREERAQAPATA